MVTCETVEEVDQSWNKLIVEGKVMMPLDSYPWSERYGWVQDRFEINWQLYYGKMSDVGQKFCPTLMFTHDQFGKAEEAIHFYNSVFPNSTITGILKYAAEDEDEEGKVKHAQFSIDGFVMMAMESSFAHSFRFSEGISIAVECDTQKEIDHFWYKMTFNGGEESMCGWLKDKYGVSWQIIPSVLEQLMKEPERFDRVVQAFMQMRKFDLAKILSA
jgi:predicted 3-demethylubiquinone-9 3-methyltransferase (glyoxalase superfamily)